MLPLKHLFLDVGKLDFGPRVNVNILIISVYEIQIFILKTVSARILLLGMRLS